MRTIIAGSRHLVVKAWFIQDMMEHFNILKKTDVVVSGGAEGIDKCGEFFAIDMKSMDGTEIDVKVFPAEWDKHGKSAGPIRNKQMAEYADMLLLIWDGESKGSANMKLEMKKLGKPVYEVILRAT